MSVSLLLDSTFIKRVLIPWTSHHLPISGLCVNYVNVGFGSRLGVMSFVMYSLPLRVRNIPFIWDDEAVAAYPGLLTSVDILQDPCFGMETQSTHYHGDS